MKAATSRINKIVSSMKSEVYIDEEVKINYMTQKEVDPAVLSAEDFEQEVLSIKENMQPDAHWVDTFKAIDRLR